MKRRIAMLAVASVRRHGIDRAWTSRRCPRSTRSAQGPQPGATGVPRTGSVLLLSGGVERAVNAAPDTANGPLPRGKQRLALHRRGCVHSSVSAARSVAGPSAVDSCDVSPNEAGLGRSSRPRPKKFGLRATHSATRCVYPNEAPITDAQSRKGDSDHGVARSGTDQERDGAVPGDRERRNLASLTRLGDVRARRRS